MPYITAADFQKVQHLIVPGDQSNEVLRLEAEIYALNRRIRALPGTEPTPEWLALKDEHAKRLAAYRAVGGCKL